MKHEDANTVKKEGNSTRIPLILVVDDDWMNREVLEAHLTEAGYDVMVAHSGEKALEAAGDNPPDLVLLDVRLPGMNGYDVCRRLKADAATQFAAVMLVTALERDEDRDQAVAAGADEFVSKSFPSATLLMRVKSLLYAKYLRDDLRNYDHVLGQVLSRYVDDLTAQKILADVQDSFEHTALAGRTHQ